MICHYLVMACSVFSLSSPAPPLLSCLLQTDSNLVCLAIYPAEGKGNRNLELHHCFPTHLSFLVAIKQAFSIWTREKNHMLFIP